MSRLGCGSRLSFRNHCTANTSRCLPGKSATDISLLPSQCTLIHGMDDGTDKWIHWPFVGVETYHHARILIHPLFTLRFLTNGAARCYPPRPFARTRRLRAFTSVGSPPTDLVVAVRHDAGGHVTTSVGDGIEAAPTQTTDVQHGAHHPNAGHACSTGSLTCIKVHPRRRIGA